jgi:predicted dehydrogenase
MMGRGFAAKLHADAWRRVAGIDVEIVSGDVLRDARVDVVDLCIPNHVHAEYAIAALDAGKHVIVEKPLTGCFVARADMPAREMLERAVASADAIVAATRAADRWCCYAENWLYAPPVVKARALVDAADGTVLRIHGEESRSWARAVIHWAPRCG